MLRPALFAEIPLIVRQIIAVFHKDLRSEIKTRYAINAVLMFVLTTVAMIVFSTADERLSNGLASGILWIIMFFSAMTGLSKTFVSEEERGTGLLLQLSTPPTAVYFGKLFFNILLTVVLYTAAVLLFFLFIHEITIKTPLLFAAVLLLGSIATASATTIIAAIIARANTRSALFPVLSFPILLPLVLSGVEATYQSLAGIAFGQAQSNLIILASYSVVLVAVSTMLFDFVWKD